MVSLHGLCVLNAFRHHGQGDWRSFPEEVSGVPVLNAFRHHGQGDDGLRVVAEHRRVLNAFRHHGQGDKVRHEW